MMEKIQQVNMTKLNKYMGKKTDVEEMQQKCRNEHYQHKQKFKRR